METRFFFKSELILQPNAIIIDVNYPKFGLEKTQGNTVEYRIGK